MNKPQSAPLREALVGVPGRYWERLADGRIQCDLCPRYCKLHDGQRGLCFVRARREFVRGVAGHVIMTISIESRICNHHGAIALAPKRPVVAPRDAWDRLKRRRGL
ncbi:MAG: pyruvate formate lyase activating enzyme [Methylocystaceae bacterium]|nr:MAG: pyruvate formate lyase activating enzyme [Methylocystaceae bacterium]